MTCCLYMLLFPSWVVCLWPTKTVKYCTPGSLPLSFLLVSPTHNFKSQTRYSEAPEEGHLQLGGKKYVQKQIFTYSHSAFLSSPTLFLESELSIFLFIYITIPLSLNQHAFLPVTVEFDTPQLHSALTT